MYNDNGLKLEELNKEILTINDCVALDEKHNCDVICGNGKVLAIRERIEK